ncbi:MAG: mechanosensitive ion channel family protein [Candidatus Paceibacterota bacterium]|nr:mechanosensitive ion channel family protein [Candidatus Nomurabacteria bacterium]
MSEDQIIQITNTLWSWVISDGVKILVIILVAIIANKIIKKVIEKVVRKMVVSVPGENGPDAEKRREDTIIAIFYGTVRVVIWIVVLIMILDSVGVAIAPILAAAGVIGLAVGFGAQYLIRDIITGLFIIIENQYRVGDIIEVSGKNGVVERLTLRATTIRDLNGVLHHVPNGEVTYASNFSKDFSRININLGVSYESDIDKVEKVVNEVGVSMTEDANWKNKILSAPKFMRIDSFDDSQVTIKVLGDVVPLSQWEVAGEFRRRIKEAFDKNNIEIPYPHMVIKK